MTSVAIRLVAAGMFGLSTALLIPQRGWETSVGAVLMLLSILLLIDHRDCRCGGCDYR